MIKTIILWGEEFIFVKFENEKVHVKRFGSDKIFTASYATLTDSEIEALNKVKD